MEQLNLIRIKILNDRQPRNGETGVIDDIVAITDTSKGLYNNVCFKVRFDYGLIEYYPLSGMADYQIWAENNTEFESTGPLK